ncbi:CoA-binding protein [Nocardioides sp. Kera G14]|uniref:CoA-binding protein n=1 Tax=Nocardioides sp. Kera G14 TaxID=2884264 RepID=UPI001D0FA28F|nr:CoA-binding protein [Nocardioides sp. Kera G14]UDY22767.1 CoA-binding protein [Nocardioides sp. Kera G14]
MSETRTWLDPATIDRLLDDSHTWAVVGLSGDPYRTAYSIAQELQQHGKRIIPIHPEADEIGEVLGEKVYPTLASAAAEVGQIDVVDVFRRSEAAGQFADEAVAIGAGGVWFQMGVVDEAAFRRTSDAGVPMVMDVCPSQIWWRRARSAQS